MAQKKDETSQNTDENLQIKLSPETQLAAREGLLATSLSDSEVVMMDIDQGRYYGLEDVGKLIWDFLAEPHSVAEVCEEVKTTFDIDKETADKDTTVFLAHLLTEGLLHEPDAQTPASPS